MRNDTFQRQPPLRFSISAKQTGWGWLPTRDREFVLFGGPILIEGLLDVDIFDILVLLCPRQMTALDLNLYTRIRCWRNISICAQALVSGCSGETEDTRALDWYPGLVVFPLQLYG